MSEIDQLSPLEWKKEIQEVEKKLLEKRRYNIAFINNFSQKDILKRYREEIVDNFSNNRVDPLGVYLMLVNRYFVDDELDYFFKEATFYDSGRCGVLALPDKISLTSPDDLRGYVFTFCVESESNNDLEQKMMGEKFSYARQRCDILRSFTDFQEGIAGFSWRKEHATM